MRGVDGSESDSKSRFSGMRSKESMVFLKSDKTELILNPVFGGNVTKHVKSRASIMTV